MGGSDELTVFASDLMSHAGHIDAVGDAVDLAKRAGDTIRPGPSAYGRLCQWVPLVLGQLQDVVVDAIASGARSLHDTADTLRVVGSSYCTLTTPTPPRSVTSGERTVSDTPLVAARDDQVDPWAGVWIAEDIESICAGVKNGSWVDGSLGSLGFGLDGLALVSDPVGVLLQYGVAWIIEHVRPLS
jgi:hypothetical protein